VAGVGSLFPEVSMARTSKVWLPDPTRVKVWGLVQGVKREPSKLHSKLATPLSSASEPMNSNVMELERVDPPFCMGFPLRSTAERIVIDGDVAVRSTVAKDRAVIAGAETADWTA